MNRINRYLTVFVLALIGAALGQSAQASVTVLSGGDVGEGFAPSFLPVYAYHMYSDLATGDPGAYTIQGITFQSFDLFNPPSGFSAPATGFASSWSYYTAGGTPDLGATSNDNALEQMMSNGTYFYSHINGTDVPESLTLTGLTAGKSYQVDMIVLNSGGPITAQDTQFDFSGGQTDHFTAALDTYYDVSENVVANGSGQIIVALTSPDGDYSVNFNGAPRLSAFAVTEVPEPCSAAIASVGGLVLLGRRRRAVA